MRREHQLQQVIPPSPLPAGYTQLDYIGATGTQYIRTNLTGYTTYWKWYSLGRPAYYDTTNNANFIIHGNDGAYGNGRIMSMVGGTTSGGTNNFDYVGGTGYKSVSLSANIPYGTLMEIYEDHDHVEINGTSYNLSKGNLTLNVKTLFFAQKFNSSTWGYSSAICKRFKVWDNNDNLKLDGYPALRNSDNKPGLYDLVTNTFFTNAGSGEFLYG